MARPTRARTEEQYRRDQEKIQNFQALVGEVRGRARDRQFDLDTFQLTTQLLRLNPEYYTIWNNRRHCLFAYGVKADQDQRSHDTLAIRSELEFTIPLLIEFPKCYWIWHHRLWTLQQAIKRLDKTTACTIWKEELGLVSKMLTKDQRNFHAWGYRRHVIAQLESPALEDRSLAESEFRYTTQKIESNLSNFSAWHNRSQLIPRLLTGRNADDNARKQFLDDGMCRW